MFDVLRKNEEVLNINKNLYENFNAMFSKNDPRAIAAQNNIAVSLANQGNWEQSFEIYRDVLDKKKSVLIVNHTDDLHS